jgi:cobalt-zinc-cadmium efflux system outer membrane protein
MEGRLLERAARARSLVELQYQKGAASLLEYLDAQRTYVSTKGEYIQDLAAYWNAIFQIEAATATELVQ